MGYLFSSFLFSFTDPYPQHKKGAILVLFLGAHQIVLEVIRGSAPGIM